MRRAVSFGIVSLSLSLIGGACAEPQLQQVGAPPAPEAAESAERAPLPWPNDLDLVELANVGDVPPAERTTTVVVRADGSMTVDGVTADVEAFAVALRATGPDPAPGERRDHCVLFALDRDVRWRPVQRLMITCAIEDVSQLFYAARPTAGGEPGAIALFLPEDRGVMHSRPAARPAVTVKVRSASPRSDPRGMAVVVEDMLSSTRADALAVNLDAAPTAPVGLVLQLADQAASGGATSIGFSGVPLGYDEVSIAVEVTTLAARPAALHVTARNAALPPGAADRSVPPRRHGAFAGFPRSEPIHTPEVEIVEPDEDGESEPR